MTGSDEILDTLQRRAERFEFPVLDNANARLIAGRLRGFRRQEDWGLLFELLVFGLHERAIVTDVYAYGPLIGDKEWDLIQVGGIDEVPGNPLWDESGRWISGPGVRVISIADQRLTVSCGNRGGGALALTADECRNEIEFTCAIVRGVGLERLIPANVSFDRLPGFAVAQELFSLTNWDHPNIAGGESPRDSLAILAAAKVLSGEAESMEYDHSRDNVDPEIWAPEE